MPEIKHLEFCLKNLPCSFLLFFYRTSGAASKYENCHDDNIDSCDSVFGLSYSRITLE